MPTFDNKESGLSVRNKLNEVIVAIEQIDTGDVATVADNITSVNTTASNISDVNTVATDIADVNTTATNIADVQVVAADLNETTSEIEVVAGSIADVNSVGTNISDVTTVATNVGDVQTVASDLNETSSDIEVVSTSITNVNNVGSNIGNVNTVAGISTDVTAVAGDEADIGIVAADITNVNTVSSSIADVNTTASSISDVQTVSTNITNVNSVGTDIADVNTVANALNQPLSAASGVSYDNTSSGLAATDVQGAIDDVVALSPGTKQQVAQGFIQREQTRGDLDVDLAVAIELNLLGAPVAGGYYAGLIDTLTGNIIAADDYQTGLRYALIVSDKSLEGGRGSSPASGLPTGDLEWDTQDRGGEAGCFTRWNGLEATNVIIAKAEAAYEAHGFIADVRSQYPAVATPGGSEWYLPAMDELELLYRNFKPNNADNRDDTRNRVFPGTQVVGTNPSSAIEGFQYENNPRIPDVTYLDLFKEGNAQSLDQLRYWSTTDADEGGRAWKQRFTSSGTEGFQFAFNKGTTVPSVRPVRRVVL